MKDQLYRKAYDAHRGVKNESLAYDFWCKGWEAAKKDAEVNPLAQDPIVDITSKVYKAFR